MSYNKDVDINEYINREDQNNSNIIDINIDMHEVNASSPNLMRQNMNITGSDSNLSIIDTQRQNNPENLSISESLARFVLKSKTGTSESSKEINSNLLDENINSNEENSTTNIFMQKKIEQKDNNPIFKTKKNSIYETFNNNTNNNNMKQELSPEMYAKMEEEDKKLKIKEEKVKEQMKNLEKEYNAKMNLLKKIQKKKEEFGKILLENKKQNNIKKFDEQSSISRESENEGKEKKNDDIKKEEEKISDEDEKIEIPNKKEEDANDNEIEKEKKYNDINDIEEENISMEKKKEN